MERLELLEYKSDEISLATWILIGLFCFWYFAPPELDDYREGEEEEEEDDPVEPLLDVSNERFVLYPISDNEVSSHLFDRSVIYPNLLFNMFDVDMGDVQKGGGILLDS